MNGEGPRRTTGVNAVLALFAFLVQFTPVMLGPARDEGAFVLLALLTIGSVFFGAVVGVLIVRDKGYPRLLGLAGGVPIFGLLALLLINGRGRNGPPGFDVLPPRR